MGEYATLSIANQEVDSWKNCIGGEAASLFTEEDILEYDYLVEYEYDTHGNAKRLKKPKFIPGYRYVNTAKNVIERLEIMGITLSKAKQHFQAGMEEKLRETETSRESLRQYIPPSHFDEQCVIYSTLSYEVWLQLVKEILAVPYEKIFTEQWRDKGHPLKKENPFLYYMLAHDISDNSIFGFPSNCSSYWAYRSMLEVVDPKSHVEVDFTFLVDWVEEEAYSCSPPKRMILTEGTSDQRILEGTLRLLYPHLYAYFDFMDFAASAMPGGTSHLVNMIKGFVATGGGRQCVALFDNDAAGHDAVRQLTTIKLPSHIKVLTLPPIELAKNYPTVGPQGDASMDIDGAACSIELYLGKDVLTGQDGKLSPILWGNWIPGVRRYQGELKDKQVIQDKYLRLLTETERNPTLRQQHDWSGMKAVFEAIFAQCRS